MSLTQQKKGFDLSDDGTFDPDIGLPNKRGSKTPTKPKRNHSPSQFHTPTLSPRERDDGDDDELNAMRDYFNRSSKGKSPKTRSRNDEIESPIRKPIMLSVEPILDKPPSSEKTAQPQEIVNSPVSKQEEEQHSIVFQGSDTEDTLYEDQLPISKGPLTESERIFYGYNANKNAPTTVTTGDIDEYLSATQNEIISVFTLKQANTNPVFNVIDEVSEKSLKAQEILEATNSHIDQFEDNIVKTRQRMESLSEKISSIQQNANVANKQFSILSDKIGNEIEHQSSTKMKVLQILLTVVTYLYWLYLIIKRIVTYPFTKKSGSVSFEEAQREIMEKNSHIIEVVSEKGEISDFGDE